MSSWRKCKLGEVVSLNNKSIDKNYKFENIQYLDTGSITNNKIDGFQEFKISEAPSRAKRLVKHQDIVYSTVRPIQRHFGLIKNPQENLVVSTGFSVIETNQKLAYPKFIYYFLSSDETVEILDVIAEASTSTYPSLKPSDIEDIDISLPPLEEQKAIAEVLSSLDDKIDLLHRQNKTLEELAQTLFRQWFIEEAKEEWEDISLDKCCIKITKGTTPTTLKKQFVESGINFIKVNCIDERGSFLKDKFDFIDDETNKLLNRSKLEKGDILYSIAGTIGRLAMVNDEILPANVNQALAILRIDKSVINPYFVKYCLLDKDITFELHSKIVHAVQPNLSLGEISNTLIPYPPKEILDSFLNQIEPIEEKINQNKQQIQTLENLRDTLLPKLMSEEVRVEI